MFGVHSWKGRKQKRQDRGKKTKEKRNVLL